MKTIVQRAMVGAAIVMSALVVPAVLSAQRTTISYGDMRARTGAVPAIGVPISSEFGTYIPYRVPLYTPSIGNREGAIRTDFSNVDVPFDAFSWESYFTAAERRSLTDARLLIRSEPMGSFAQAYAEAGDRPAFAHFITTDAAMNGLRVTAHEAYAYTQRNHLQPALSALLENLSSGLQGAVANESQASVKSAMVRTLAWVETGRVLLDRSVTPAAAVADAVEREIAKIDAGRSDKSTIYSGRQINYGAIAAGATADGGLDGYMQAKSWLSETGPRIGASIEEARMAVVLAQMIDLGTDRQHDGLEQINAVESFFAGRADADLSLDAVSGALRSYYGFQYGTGYGHVATDASVKEMIAYLAKHKGRGVSDAMQLSIVPRAASATDGLFASLRSSGGEMGSRFVASMRAPGGGSLSALFGRIPAEEWAKNAEWVSLYTASILAENRAAGGYPLFMRSKEWGARTGRSALAAAVAMTEPSGAIASTNRPISLGAVSTPTAPDRAAQGYVEPDPEAWSAVAAQAAYIRNGLAEGPHGMLISGAIEEKLRDIENSAAHFMLIAAQELQDMPLDAEQTALVAAAPKRIAAWETYTDASLRSPGALLTASADARGGALGPALGLPQAIYVVVPTGNGELLLTRGAVYSYGETAQGSDEWVRSLTVSGASTGATVSVDAIRPVEARIDQAMSPLQKGKGRTASNAVTIALESSVVRRSSGAIWYTVTADGYEGADIVATVVDASGQALFRSNASAIENGERYDMVPTENLASGNYFIRISDIDGRTLASGRFMIVR